MVGAKGLLEQSSNDLYTYNATQFIESNYNLIKERLKSEKIICYVSNYTVQSYKKENNLLNVKNKIWHKGMLLKTI